MTATPRFDGGARYDVCVAVPRYLPRAVGPAAAARMLAEGLAARGRSVAVVTTRHDRAVPRRERVNGVEVFRATVLRGVAAPGYPALVARVAGRARVLNLHLPVLEAASVVARCGAVPVVSSFHDDLPAPSAGLTALRAAAVDRSARHALVRSRAVLVGGADQAQRSRLWPVIRACRWHAVAPPRDTCPADVARWLDAHQQVLDNSSPALAPAVA